MTKITVNFKNLCALFTKKLNDELMVGLLDLADYQDVPEEHIHHPRITIETEKQVVNPNGETVSVPQVWTYAGFSNNGQSCSHDSETHSMSQPPDCLGPLFGEIILEVHGVNKGLNLLNPTDPQIADKIAELTQQETEKKREAKEIEEDQEVIINAFDSVLDFQKRLHKNETLKVMPELCKARFHFQHGLLYAISMPPFLPVKFEPQNLGANGRYPIETRLEIDLPEDGYAVLRFLGSDTRDFVFAGADGRHYFVTIENSPPKRHVTENSSLEDQDNDKPNHFEYYYKLVAPPHKKYLPSIEDTSAGDPFCMNGGFGDTDY